jgi:hypothetical protein
MANDPSFSAMDFLVDGGDYAIVGKKGRVCFRFLDIPVATVNICKQETGEPLVCFLNWHLDPMRHCDLTVESDRRVDQETVRAVANEVP